jgi:hypothetical protein
MRVEECDTQEMARFGATHRVVVKADDLNGTGTGYGALSASAAASTTGTLAPFTTALAASYQAQYAGYVLRTAFDGTSTTSLTATLGYDLASGTDKSAGYQAAVELHNDATEVLYGPAEIPDATDATTAISSLNLLIKQSRKAFAAAQNVQLLFTSTTANLTDVTSGEVHFYFRLIDLSKQ